MPVNLKPTSEIKARLGLDPNGRVQSFFTNTCYKHMDKYVPMDEGNLRTNVDIERIVSEVEEKLDSTKFDQYLRNRKKK